MGKSDAYKPLKISKTYVGNNTINRCFIEDTILPNKDSSAGFMTF